MVDGDAGAVSHSMVTVGGSGYKASLSFVATLVGLAAIFRV